MDFYIVDYFFVFIVCEVFYYVGVLDFFFLVDILVGVYFF